MIKIIQIFGVVALLWHVKTVRAEEKPINPDIKFLQGVSWQDVLKIAKDEGKNVFVDCYTTWCGPCKKMEKEVYTDEEASRLYNGNFICYKLQMDSTKNDNEIVRASYPDARFFKTNYNVNVFPTTMFFSPDGKLLNRQEGAVTVNDFIKLGKDVLDPQKNYYILLESYNNGKRDLNEMSTIARMALLTIKDTNIAKSVAKDYITRLPKRDYLTKENIEFMQVFTKTSNDIGFKVFYDYADSIDRIMNDKMYAQSLIRSVIFKEMVLQDIQKAKAEGKEPDWNNLSKAIKQKYNSYYSDIVITAIKLDWTRSKKDWKEYTKMVVLWVDRYTLPSGKKGHWVAFGLNNFAWDIFLHSNDMYQLERALSWSNQAVMMDPIANWMDTYANLLYKLGDKDLAIQWEEIATRLAPDDKDLKSALTNMKEGNPTWPQ